MCEYGGKSRTQNKKFIIQSTVSKTEKKFRDAGYVGDLRE